MVHFFLDFKFLVFLFCSFFKIALFVVGGGLAMVPVIEDVFVREKKLLKEKDILDMIAIMQTMPGMLAVNAAICVGYKLAGLKGAVVSVIGVIMPSIAIIMLIAALFMNLDVKNPHILMMFSCVRACVVAVFLGTAYRLFKNAVHSLFDYVFLVGFVVALMCGVSQIKLILLSMPIGWGYVLYWRFRMRRKK